MKNKYFCKKSNVLIITLGSRGDVQPYVALGKGLKKLGHSVTICTCSSFAPFITHHGLNYGYMNNDFLQLIDSEVGREAIERGGNFFGLLKTIFSLIKDAKALYTEILSDSWLAAQEAKPDIIIFHPKSFGSSHIAEKLGIPAIMAVPVPLIVPTAESVAIGFPNLPLGRWYNKLSYLALHKGYSAYSDVVNEFRQNVLGIEKLPKLASPIHTVRGEPIPVLHCYSELVSPRPQDWHNKAYVTGYWFLEQEDDWQPPIELRDFLAAGEKPVYVGFGSMAGRNPQRTASIVVDALQKAKVRGIIATGWGGLDASNLPETIFKIEQAPHDWLFPRMSAVVHHGGAGTTAMGLRAGKPTLICPFSMDQPYWGRRVYNLGVGSKPIPQKHLTVNKLALAIEEITTNQVLQKNAETLGAKIRQEDGIKNAIAIMQSLQK